MDNVIKDANSEISGLRDKLERMHQEKKTLEQKNQELISAFSEKSKAHQRLTKLYQRAKGNQDAQQMYRSKAQASLRCFETGHHRDQSQCPEEEVARTCLRCTAMAEWAAMVVTRTKAGQVKARVVVHNLPLSQNIGSPSMSGGGMAGFGARGPTSSQRQATPNRQPLSEMNRNATSSQGYGGYGSATGGGVKVGGSLERPPPVNRNLSRVIHR
ncbi:hypothetical protein D6C83_07939 [Aureobasidium pullulans]|uniref:Uncharacterized protein n=1 Tax=Aureobasidium pullulans TaxID=5580 RepID=A0A4T0AX41_AURPU|nr:hypothetical protein D6C83_07939 [Aureobasidium pullulans]